MPSSNVPVPPSALDEEDSLATAIEDRRAHKPAASSYVIPATFASAGLANAVSAGISNPFDVIKVRQQLLLSRSGPAIGTSTASAGEAPVKANFYSLAKEMTRREGILSLWSGVTASCCRELSYSTIRMGGYEPCKELYCNATGLPQSSFLIKMLAGVTSGALGAAVASPTDLVKVRMQAARPTGKPPFRNTFIGFVEVYREGANSKTPEASVGVAGGIKSLWRGVLPTVFRAALLTSSQIGTYDQVKNLLKEGRLIPGNYALDEGIGLHFTASMIAGFACSVASQPIDVIKTRLMQDKDRKYSGSAVVIKKLLLNEGPLAFYKGFSMCWARLGVHSMVSLMLFEQFRALFGIKPI